MRQITIAGMAGILALLLPGCAASRDGGTTAAGQPSASTAAAGGTCRAPFPGTPHIQACSYPHGLRSISYAAVNQYYWRPDAGDFAVAETFYRQAAPGRAAGAWAGRTISVGDGCVIDESWQPDVHTPPANCMDSRDGEYRAATSEEQRSVLRFWQLMTTYAQPGSY